MMKPVDSEKNFKLFERSNEKELPIDWTGKRGITSFYIFSDPKFYAISYKNDEEWRDVMERTDFLKCRQTILTNSEILNITKFLLENRGFVLDLYFNEKLSEEEEQKKYEILQKFYELAGAEYREQFEPIRELIEELDRKNKFLTGIKLGKEFGTIKIYTNGIIKIKMLVHGIAKVTYEHELEWLEELLKGATII